MPGHVCAMTGLPPEDQHSSQRTDLRRLLFHGSAHFAVVYFGQVRLHEQVLALQELIVAQLWWKKVEKRGVVRTVDNVRVRVCSDRGLIKQRADPQE